MPSASTEEREAECSRVPARAARATIGRERLVFSSVGELTVNLFVEEQEAVQTLRL